MQAGRPAFQQQVDGAEKVAIPQLLDVVEHQDQRRGQGGQLVDDPGGVLEAEAGRRLKVEQAVARGRGAGDSDGAQQPGPKARK